MNNCHRVVSITELRMTNTNYFISYILLIIGAASPSMNPS